MLLCLLLKTREKEASKVPSTEATNVSRLPHEMDNFSSSQIRKRQWAHPGRCWECFRGWVPLIYLSSQELFSLLDQTFRPRKRETVERRGWVRGMCFLLHILRSSIWCFFQYQLVTSSCLTWTVGWFYSVLQGSFSSQPDAIKGWKEQWKMQLGAWMFSGVATYWPIFIRLSGTACVSGSVNTAKRRKRVILNRIKTTPFS